MLFFPMLDDVGRPGVLDAAVFACPFARDAALPPDGPIAPDRGILGFPTLDCLGSPAVFGAVLGLATPDGFGLGALLDADVDDPGAEGFAVGPLDGAFVVGAVMAFGTGADFGLATVGRFRDGKGFRGSLGLGLLDDMSAALPTDLSALRPSGFVAVWALSPDATVQSFIALP